MRHAAVMLALWLVIAGTALGKDEAAPQDPPGLVRMTAEQQKTVAMKIVQAERRAITEPVRVPGTIAFDQGHVALIRPLAQSRVLRILVQPGDGVRAGQTLAELDVPNLSNAQADLAGAQASVREADAGVAVARDAFARGEILARDGSLARAEAERRRLVLAQTEAAAQTARARMGALQAEVTRLHPGTGAGIATLVSPIAGVVVSVGVTPGELVDTTGVAFTVADLSVVLVLAQVPESGVALLAIGTLASVHMASGGDRGWDGQVVALGAALDPQARTLPARIQLANADGALRAGMFVTVTLTSDRGRENLVVPSAAVQRVDDKPVAFQPLGGDRFQSRNLTLGVERPDWTEIRDGLQPGDEVVTNGSFELKAVLQKSMLGG